MSIFSKTATVVVFVSSLAVLATARDAAAQTACNTTLSGTYDNITVTGGLCTLSNATVLGNVSVTAGGRLTTTGTTQINGSVEGFGAGNLTLTSGTVMGDVSVLNSQNITVGTAANIGALNSTNSGTLTLRGTISKVTATDSMAVNITGATIATGVIIDAGNANLTICGGAAISGGIVMSNTNGGLLVGVTAGCGVSSIDGTIIVSNGTGAVRLTGTTMASSDVLVTQQIGNVILNNVALSDLNVELLTGAVTLTNVTTDSDTKLKAISSTTTITGSTLGSDVTIETSAAVNLTGNNFTNESLLISGGTGTLTIANNLNLSVSVVERGTVSFTGNNFGTAFFSKNGALSVIGNTGTLLECVDNTPAPTGSSNTVTTKLGQCSAL
jgi:hypothetical protein